MFNFFKINTYKKALIILQILFLCFSCFTINSHATAIQEEVATNPDVGWITFQAHVDPNLETSIVEITILNLDTQIMEHSYILYRVNDYKEVIEFSKPGKYQITSCSIENNLFYTKQFEFNVVDFEVKMNKNTLVEFNVGNPNAEFTTETTTAPVTTNPVILEEVTTEEITTFPSDINIIENTTQNSENDSSITLTSIAVFCISILGLLIGGFFLACWYIKKKNNA